MLGERDGLGGRLRAAVRDHRQRPGHGQLEHALPLGARQEDALARRAAGEDPVDAAPREEREVRPDRRLVERGAVVGERRQRRGDRAGHGWDLT